MSRFRDHFSGHAREYARARPRYPRELYGWLVIPASVLGLVIPVVSVGIFRKFVA